MADGQRATDRCIDLGHGRQRHHVAGLRRTQVEVVQALGLGALLRVEFKDDVVLIDLGLELIHLSLAKGVIERFIDIGGGQSEARGGVSVDADVGDAGAQLQVVGQVAKGRVGAQFFRQALGPGSEGRPVIALEHVLILAAAGAGAQVDVLSGAQVQHDAGHFGQLRAYTVDELTGRHIALTAVFEGDPETPVGDGLVAAGHAHGVRKRLDGRIVADDVGQCQMLFHHVRVGHVGGSLAGAQHKAGVLHREEPFGDQHITGHGHGQRYAKHPQH